MFGWKNVFVNTMTTESVCIKDRCFKTNFRWTIYTKKMMRVKGHAHRNIALKIWSGGTTGIQMVEESDHSVLSLKDTVESYPLDLS